MIKRKLVFIGMLFVFLICAMGSAFAAADNTVISYENKIYDFKLEHPNEWVAKEGLMGTVVAFISMKESPSEFHPNATITVGDLTNYPTMTLDQYDELSMLQLKQMVTDFKLISNTTCTFANHPGIMYLFDAKQGIYNLRYMQVYTLYNNKAYIFTFTCDTKAFNNYEQIANAMINSFHIN